MAIRMTLEDKLQKHNKPKEKSWKELCSTKEAAQEYYDHNYSGKTAIQLKSIDSGFYRMLRLNAWSDILPRQRKDWSFIETKEDATKYYQENLAGKTSKQVQNENISFYGMLQKRGWLDILLRERKNWDFLETKEDATKYYQENLASKTSKQVQNENATFYTILQQRGWLDILPKHNKDWSSIKTKEDAIKYYQENLASKTSKQVQKEANGFYYILEVQHWLDILPRQRKDWSFIKSKEDAIKYYQENLAGKTPEQVKKEANGFYHILMSQHWSDILPRRLKDWSFLKTKEDAIKYYQENLTGKTIKQVQDETGTFYTILRQRGWLDILPRQLKDWRFIKTKEDALTYLLKNFAGMATTIVSKTDSSFYNLLQQKGWLDMLHKKKKLFGKNLRDYSASTPTKAEVGENLFTRDEKENGERVREIDFGAGLEDIIDYISPDEAKEQDTQVRTLLRLLSEQNNKENALALCYSDRLELIALYNAGVSCAQTSAALLYRIFEILNTEGKEVSTVLDIGGAHGFASIKAKNEFEKNYQKDLELSLIDMDVSGLNLVESKRDREDTQNFEIRAMALPYDASDFIPEEHYDLITATYFFCELNPQEIKETVQQLPKSRYFFATLPPSNTEKRDILIQSLKEKGYKIRYGLFPVKLEDSFGQKLKYTVIAIGGTKS